MKALVTGGLGFIGSHLVERLLQIGHSIIILCLPNGPPRNIAHLFDSKDVLGKIHSTSFVDIDIRNCSTSELANLMTKEGIDCVFHLAGIADVVPSINRPIDYFNTNVTGTLNVLEAARWAGVKKFVYASSSSVYGICNPVHIPTHEWAPIRPQYPYAETKYQGERWVSHYNRVYGLPTISLRLFNVYGTRARTTGAYGAVFGTFLAQKINNKPFTVVGDGLQLRDFVFVTDVCDAFIKAAESPVAGEIFNVGSGKPQSILRLCNLLGGDIVYIPKRPGEPDCTWADITEIKRVLGWRPQVSFREGVKIILDNIDYWKDAPVWTPETISEATKDWFKILSRPREFNG